MSSEMKRKTYKERCNFILSLFNNLHIYYPVTPRCDAVIEAYAKFTGFKVDKLGRCNQLSRDFTRMHKEKLIVRSTFGNECCAGNGKPKWSYIYDLPEN
jgi:hypothetical protein|nr:MAG TPA: hypothetical protein [Bacteriophage sp.]